jgi:hypothetical protein
MRSPRRVVAMAASTLLLVALVAPAGAQPFADVPTNHWAYDAIAELAAKGLIEGYPDGTFKGDRAMTRYEMAMVVARLLARIESIQIPAPPKPEVTKADLEAIQRLVNEFRAELAALGVRVTAIEEELNAIKARLDNARISGAFRFRYDTSRSATNDAAHALTGINGNGLTGVIDASGQAQLPIAREAFKLAVDGTVAPDVHVILSLLTNGVGSAYAVFNSSAMGPASQWTAASIDNLFFDWKNAFGGPVEIWLGRFGGTELGTTYPVQFGPFGLLMNTSGDTWEDSTADSAMNVVDGLRIAGGAKVLEGLQWQAVILRVTGGTGASSYFTGEDAYGLDVNVGVLPGLRIGLDYVGNNIVNPQASAFVGAVSGVAFNTFAANLHTYGPGGGALNPGAVAGQPSGLHCAGGTGAGIICPAAGHGWGAYVQWDAAPGMHLDGEYASWNDSVFNSTDIGWQVNITWDLDKLLHAGHSLTVQTGYLNYGQNFYPPYGAAEADMAMGDVLYPGNQQGFLVQISFAPVEKWTVYGIGFFGNSITPNLSEVEWEAGVQYQFAAGSQITLKVRDLRIGNVEQFLLYRAQLDYAF